ncbi:hypothetical protein EIP86_003419 [Pleurotus ostreatoroseus]|nr:hypothetical protein EIP86_003419 [Pleurotus ostreatoroseus]
MTICTGCTRHFKGSGYYSHIRLSKNAECRALYDKYKRTMQARQARLASVVPGLHVNEDPDLLQNLLAQQVHFSDDVMSQPFSGDMFGSSEDYTDEALGLDLVSDDVDMQSVHSHTSKEEPTPATAGEDEDIDDDDENDAWEAESIVSDDDVVPRPNAEDFDNPNVAPESGYGDSDSDQDYTPSERIDTSAPSSAASSQESDPGSGSMSEPDRLSELAYAQSLAGRTRIENNLREEIEVIKFPSATAGRPIPNKTGVNAHEDYEKHLSPDKSWYYPWNSAMNYEIARWAKRRAAGSNAVNELLRIPGLVDTLGLQFSSVQELNALIDSLPDVRPRFRRGLLKVDDYSLEFECIHRDAELCVAALFSNPIFAPHMVYAPEIHKSKGTKERLYHDIFYGTWAWATQEQLEANVRTQGGTIVPIVVNTDKTKLTMIGNKAAYPVYMTIGNIPKEIRRKPSRQAYVLLGYIPVAQLDRITNKAARRRVLQNLMHAAVRMMLKPLVEPGTSGIDLANGFGQMYRCYPILCGHTADYQEQVTVTGIKYGECPLCTCPRDALDDFTLKPAHPFRDLERVLEALDKVEGDIGEYKAACKAVGIKPIYRPYWHDMPYCDIYLAMTPDVLHQLYQGLIKHLVSWIKSAYSTDELDARCRVLPRNHHVRHFFNGISKLSKLTGSEHADIARVLMGLIADLPLKTRIARPRRLLRAVRGLLDFVYFAQYPVHSESSLQQMEAALALFHENKDIFVDLGIRENWNVPKLHWARHYVEAIKYLGTTDNFNTEYTERLHIDYVKDAYRATNHKDEYDQMTLYMERKEKMLRHEQYIAQRTGEIQILDEDDDVFDTRGEPLEPQRPYMTKQPSERGVTFEQLEELFGATFFLEAFAEFIVKTKMPGISNKQAQKLATTTPVPFNTVSVYHKARFWLGDPNNHRIMADEWDVLHCRHEYDNAKGELVAGRFDTALVNTGTGEYVGLTGYRVAQVRVIFSLTKSAIKTTWPGSDYEPPQYLAYVEWFSKFTKPDVDHGLYGIKRCYIAGDREAAIIPLKDIRRSAHLFPKIPDGHVPDDWTSENVLDLCDDFWLNSKI